MGCVVSVRATTAKLDRPDVRGDELLESSTEFGFPTIEDPEGAFFAIRAQDCTPVSDASTHREQELVGMLRVLLASPLGDGVVRDLEELYQSLNRVPVGTAPSAGLEKIR